MPFVFIIWLLFQMNNNNEYIMFSNVLVLPTGVDATMQHWLKAEQWGPLVSLSQTEAMLKDSSIALLKAFIGTTLALHYFNVWWSHLSTKPTVVI